MRATVHSLLSVAEHAGEVALGLALAVVAGLTTAATALTIPAAAPATAAVARRAADR